MAANNPPGHLLTRELGIGGAAMMGLGSMVGTGVFVSIDTDGRLAVDRGYVRPEDEPMSAGSEDPVEGLGV